MVVFTLRVHSLVCCGKSKWEASDKGVLPPSILTLVYALQLPFPIMFRVVANEETCGYGQQYCGVSEFVADEGHAFLPWWMLNNLGLEEGDRASFVIAKAIPQGKFVQLRPHKTALLDIASIIGPRLFFETCFAGKYTMLSRGETITVEHEGERFCVDVLAVSTTSAAEQVTRRRERAALGDGGATSEAAAEGEGESVVSLCGDVDLEVDFAPPLDAVRAPSPLNDSSAEVAAAVAAVAAAEAAQKQRRRRRKWAPHGAGAPRALGIMARAFVGRGNRLSASPRGGGAVTAAAAAAAASAARVAVTTLGGLSTSSAPRRRALGPGRQISPTAARSGPAAHSLTAAAPAEVGANSELRMLAALRRQRSGRSSPTRRVAPSGGAVVDPVDVLSGGTDAPLSRMARQLRQAQLMSMVDIDAASAAELLRACAWDVAEATESRFANAGSSAGLCIR